MSSFLNDLVTATNLYAFSFWQNIFIHFNGFLNLPRSRMGQGFYAIRRVYFLLVKESDG